MALEATGISFCYPGTKKRVLSDVSIRLERGERVGLIAPSGVGKTTLCKILAGYEYPERGTVLWDGKPLASYKGYCPVQMIWQHPEQAINPRMCMREVLLEGGIIEQRILHGLGIQQEWLSRFPVELSGGELQRFCIARALNERTEVLLADEISTMLDLITQSQIWSFLLEEIKRRSIGLLAVSHSPGIIDRVCERKLVLAP